MCGCVRECVGECVRVYGYVHICECMCSECGCVYKGAHMCTAPGSSSPGTGEGNIGSAGKLIAGEVVHTNNCMTHPPSQQ